MRPALLCSLKTSLAVCVAHLVSLVGGKDAQLGYSRRAGWRPGTHTPISVPGALLTPLAPDPVVATIRLDPHSRLVPGGGLQRWQRHEVGALEGLCLALLWVQGCQQGC